LSDLGFMQSRLLFLQQATLMQGDDDADDAVRDRLVLHPPVLQPPSRSALTGICHFRLASAELFEREFVAIWARHSSVFSIPGITFGRSGRGSRLPRAAIA
jgi:hypothetical protein